MLQNSFHLDHEHTIVSEKEWNHTSPIVQKLLSDVNEDHQVLSAYLGEIHNNLSQSSTLMQYFYQKLTDLEVEQQKRESCMKINFGKRIEKNEKNFKQLSTETNSLISNQLSELNILKIVDQRISSRIEPLEKNQQYIQCTVEYLKEGVERVCRYLREFKNDSKERNKKAKSFKNIASFRSEIHLTIQNLSDKLASVIESFEQQNSITSTFIKNEVSRMMVNAISSLISSNDSFTPLQKSLIDASSVLATHLEHRETEEKEFGLDEKSSKALTSLQNRIKNIDKSRRFQQKPYNDNEMNNDSQSELRNIFDSDEVKLLGSFYQEIDNAYGAMKEIGMRVDDFQKCIEQINNELSLVKNEIREVAMQKTTEKEPPNSMKDIQSQLILKDDKQTRENSVADSMESFITSKKFFFNFQYLKERELNEFVDSNTVKSSQAPLQTAVEGNTVFRTPLSSATKRICQLEAENLAQADQIKILQEKVNNCCQMVNSCCPLNHKGLTDSSEINSRSELSEIESLRSRVSSLERCCARLKPMEGTVENVSRKIGDLETKFLNDRYSEDGTFNNLRIEPVMRQIKEDIQLIHERQNSSALKYIELKQLFNSLSQQLLFSSSENKAKCNETPVREENFLLAPSLSTSTFSAYLNPQLVKTVPAASFLEEESNDFCRKYIDERLENMWLSFASLLARKKDLD